MDFHWFDKGREDNNKTMSVTQKTNWLAFAGLIVIILKLVGLEISESDVQIVIGSIVAIVGVVMNYAHRYNKGDLTVGGFKK